MNKNRKENEKEIFIDYLTNDRRYNIPRINYFFPPDKYILNIIGDNINNLISYEKPDMILPLDNDVVMIIEHFQFDSSQFITFNGEHKGTLNNKLLKKIDGNFKSIITNGKLSGKSFISTCKIDGNYKYDYYISNLKRSFNNHINKIESYKQNLIKNNISKNSKSIVTSFFIEDSSPLGNYFKYNNEFKAFNILELKEFHDMLADSNSLNYVFSGYFNGNEKTISFMSNTPKTRDFFETSLIDLNNAEYISITPKETRYIEKNKAVYF